MGLLGELSENKQFILIFFVSLVISLSAWISLGMGLQMDHNTIVCRCTEADNCILMQENVGWGVPTQCNPEHRPTNNWYCYPEQANISEDIVKWCDEVSTRVTTLVTLTCIFGAPSSLILLCMCLSCMRTRSVTPRNRFVIIYS